MNVPYVIPIALGVICGILGYILGKINSKKDNALSISLQSDLDVCKAHTKNLSIRISKLEAELATKNKVVTPKIIPFEPLLASNALGKKIKENDLKIVEGIGPKIESLFIEAGIKTWQHLSQASTEKLQSILDASGENFAMHNPSTWARQALMAYQGKWMELKDWQESLLGGKE